jgi:UDP-3-O-[3-hydroxymyristoyl] N-acetylglucosamine deacetylase
VIRRTLARPVVRASVGVHSGEDCVARLLPAEFGSGIRFGIGGRWVPARLEHARAEPGATVLAGDGVEVRVVEHLLAALDALGVTDLDVVLDRPEVPILDGSAQGWVEAVDEAGRVDGPEGVPVEPIEAVRVEDHGGVAVLGPGDAIEVQVDFGEGGPRGTLRVPRTEAAFRAEVAWARTFVLTRDVEALRASGRGRGATAENTVVWPATSMRSPDEPVRHKLLDAWGDLALLGPSRAELVVTRGSHRLHHAVLVAHTMPHSRKNATASAIAGSSGERT